MIGNDIVDLKEAAIQSDPFRSGFMKKVFSSREQAIIMASPDPLGQLWLLWAMKEATYKAHQRRFNLPTKLNLLPFQCTVLREDKSSVSGEVKISAFKYTIESTLNADYIHCTAKGLPKQKIMFMILRNSAEIKNELLSKYAEIGNYRAEELRLKKNVNNIPQIFHKNLFLNLPFSLAHHGKYTAFCLPLMNY